MRKMWPHGSVLCGSLVLLLLSVAVPRVLTAHPTLESSDVGLLRAPKPNPKRGGVLTWGSIANCTLDALHPRGPSAPMGPQASRDDLLVHMCPKNWNNTLSDLATGWKLAAAGLTSTLWRLETSLSREGGAMSGWALDDCEEGAG